MTFKHLILPAAVLDYLPATYKKCVFFTVKQNYCVQVPPKHFPNRPRYVEHSMFLMQPWKNPVRTSKTIINIIRRAT